MRSASLAAILSLVLILTRSAAAQVPALVIDGKFQDWKQIAPALIDPIDASDAAIDFGELRIAHTSAHVHLLVDFRRTINVQGLDGTVLMLMDVDGDSQTGQTEFGLDGVDIIVHLSPRDPQRPERPGMGMSVRSTTYEPDPADPQQKPLSIYDIGLMFAPTHASRRMEFRIDRGAQLPGTPALFSGDACAMKLVFINLDGQAADETEVVRHNLRSGALPLAPVDEHADPLQRDPRSALRIMNWNVFRGANFTHPDPFARTIAAINPDVILLQELPEQTSAQDLKDFLERATQSDQWQVALGTGGGDLRCAIAARLPLRESLQSVPLPNQPDRTVRAAGAFIDAGDRRLLAVAVHLRCCGRAGGPEDQQRLHEVRALSDAMTAALRANPCDGIIIAGDFNLVGTRDPMEVMAAGLDLDHTALRIAHPLNLDGRSHATWADPSQPFAPGRLDYFLYSDSSLEISRTFVYDSQHLNARWLTHYGVHPTDTRDASDHRPMVADLLWSEALRSGGEAK